MTEKIRPPEEDFKIRCPRLGHSIAFSYCRIENSGSPCPKCLDCWYRYFPVQSFFRQILTKEEWDNIFVAQPKPKVVSIVQSIERSKKQKA